MPVGKMTFVKFTESRREAYFDALRRGNHRYSAARAAGVSRELIRQYRQDHPDFADAETAAEDEANCEIENALYQSAKNGNVVAQQVWLYNRMPQRWRDKRNIEHTGKDGAPLPVLGIEFVVGGAEADDESVGDPA